MRPKRTNCSVPKNAKRSVPEMFRSVPKVFRSVLEAFHFAQTVQRPRGVVVPFRVCKFILVVSKLNFWYLLFVYLWSLKNCIMQKNQEAQSP